MQYPTKGIRTMTYSDEYLGQIKGFGVLGFSVEAIINMLDPGDPEQLKVDITNPGTEAYKSYWTGKTTARYSMDKNIFDQATKERSLEANEKMEKRMYTNKINDALNEKFGL